MSANDRNLGGRLPLYERAALNPAQKDVFDWVTATVAPWAEGAGFQART
jgi:4-carboxymuconolactone decarboxylase